MGQHASLLISSHSDGRDSVKESGESIQVSGVCSHRVHSQLAESADQLLAMPALFFLSGKRLATGILASNTRLKKPTIISSQLCSPQITSLVGSAFSGLAAELSKCAVHSILDP